MSSQSHNLKILSKSVETEDHSFFLAEIFNSIQGEGELCGVPSVFIRYSGCNLRCRWCDTPYTSWSPEGRAWSLDEILAHITDSSIRHAVVTGGEPFIFNNLGRLTETLSKYGFHVTVETAGTIFVAIHCDLLSLSPKLSNSTPDSESDRNAAAHDARRINFNALRAFVSGYEYQLKFVIESPEDVDETENLLEKLELNIPPQKVLMMPQARTREEIDSRSEWLEPICVEKGFRFCPRLHIELFGDKRGT